MKLFFVCVFFILLRKPHLKFKYVVCFLLWCSALLSLKMYYAHPLVKYFLSQKFIEMYMKFFMNMSYFNKRIYKLCMGGCFPYYMSSRVDLFFKKSQFFWMTIIFIVWPPIMCRFYNIYIYFEVKTCLFYIYKETV
jgi:hypothetical protein